MSLELYGKQIQTLSEVKDLQGTVFCRVDFNVPMSEGRVEDDTRIRAAIPTIQKLLDLGCKVVLATHAGRPKGKPTEKYKVFPMAERLSELLHVDVIATDDCTGSGITKIIDEAPPKSVILLENLRFHPGEENNDASFAAELKHHCIAYVDDAFGAIHRAHASVDALPRLFEKRYAGLLIEKELRALTPLISSPKKPFGMILGGAKISDKLKVIDVLIQKCDALWIGGAMAFTFLKSEGVSVGKSLVEQDMLPRAARILSYAREKGVQVFLPKDFRIAKSVEEQSDIRTTVDWNIPEGYMGLDIGPKTIEYFQTYLPKMKTIFWNGPLGLFEKEPFHQGTMAIAKALAQLDATTILGGGDSVAAANRAGVGNQLTHLSTGGGATLEFLEGKPLPGLVALT